MKLSGAAIWRELGSSSRTTWSGNRPTRCRTAESSVDGCGPRELRGYSEVLEQVQRGPGRVHRRGDHVVVRGIQSATGPGGSTQSRYLYLFTLSNGKITRGEYIADT